MIGVRDQLGEEGAFLRAGERQGLAATVHHLERTENKEAHLSQG